MNITNEQKILLSNLIIEECNIIKTETEEDYEKLREIIIYILESNRSYFDAQIRQDKKMTNEEKLEYLTSYYNITELINIFS